MKKSRRKRAPKLRTKLFIIIILVAIIPTAVVSWVLINSALNKEIDTETSKIQNQTLILSKQLEADDYFSHSSTSERNAVIEEVASIWDGRIQVIDESGKIIIDTYRTDISKYNISEYTMQALSGESVLKYNSSNMMLSIAQPIFSEDETVLVKPLEELEDGEEPEYRDKVEGVILVTVDMSGDASAIISVRNQMYLLWIAVICLVVLATIVILSKLFKPFRKINDEIELASDNTISRVNTRDYYELSKISDSVNRMIGRLNMLDDSRQDFVSNVSHELKTPITSMRVLADSINNMGDVPNETYKEFMQDISAELEREGQIIDDLLSMSRLDNGAASLNFEKVNLNEWLENTLKRVSPIAKAAGVDVSFESYKPVEADIDEIKLTLAITNLVENAIKYNDEGGWIKVSLNADHHYFFIKIEDSGCGIPDDAMPHLFERFYRVDKDRARSSGGTGLGLSITKQIVNLHHGAVRAHSELGEGSTFIVRIPLEYKVEESYEIPEIRDEEEDDEE